MPTERRSYRSKTELALEMLEAALALGHLQAGWVAGDDAFGMSPSYREALAALGMRYVLDVPAGFPVWPLEPEWAARRIGAVGLHASPGFGKGSARPWSSAVMSCRRKPGGR